MRLEKLSATPHPGGQRIDLSWENPDPAVFPGVRVVRRTGTWPTSPEPAAGQGRVVADSGAGAGAAAPIEVTAEGLYRLEDTRGLRGETVYYYAFFPYRGDPPDYDLDPHNRAAAMASAPYGFADTMYELLPAICHRYDTALPVEPPEDMAPADRRRGQLRRFLDLPGGQLDQLYSLARALAHLYDLDRVDGRLLPLLAQWIGWQSDYRRDFDAQRREILRAPYVYRTVGIIPSVEATVKRILGWESRTKELGHNVFLSNRPERLNLWLAERTAAGTWSEPEKPLSLNYAYEGRPAAVTDGGGKLWLFFHTLRQRARENRPGAGAGVRRQGWWDVWYKTRDPQAGWSESRPLTDGPAVDKHPSAALRGDTLWVFWDSWSESDRAWRLCYRTCRQGSWSPRQGLWHDDGVERRSPQAVAGGDGKLWLFWQERVDGSWQVRYNRHDGDGWERAEAGSLRGAAEDDPRVEEDLFVFLDPAPRLWVLWARRETVGAGRSRWRLAYRIKPDLDLEAWNWGEVAELPAGDAEAGDREPAMALDQAGDPELYWSSNRDRCWSIQRAPLDPVSLTWGTPERLTGTPFSQRGPLAVTDPAGTRLFYYSNQSLTYTSDRYRATRTVDGRYAGSTTVDTRNVAKIALRGGYHDFQTYTFDTGDRGRRDNSNRYAHDTVAFYLTPSSDDSSVIGRQRKVIEHVLRQFLPIQVRAVLTTEAPPYKESVYTYDQPEAKERRFIGERSFDRNLPENYEGLSDEHTDVACDWVWIYSLSETTKDHRSVDFSQGPDVDTSHRTWHVGLEPGGKS